MRALVTLLIASLISVWLLNMVTLTAQDRQVHVCVDTASALAYLSWLKPD